MNLPCPSLEDNQLSLLKKGGDTTLQTDKQQQPKEIWSTPHLTVHGTVEKITAEEFCDKKFGGADGYTFQQQAIYCGS